MKFAFATLLLATSLGAFANSACDNPKNDFDGLYCLNKVYIEADKELNENYKALHAVLDTAGRAALKSGQLAWINERNSKCSRSDADGFFVNLECAADTTIHRSQFLQDRIRECKGAGCMNSKLQ
jgi:uncharacterized protein YecT (DUF1311 family)